MKLFNFKFGLFLFTALFTISLVNAQDLKLPQKSPKASVSHTIGYTNIDINYSSPAVRGRQVWGNVVPYGKLWRAGANEATTIEFSTDVKLGRSKTEVPAGKYALFIMPKEEGKWTVILNEDWEQWGAYNYDESKDVARIDVAPKFKGSTERLTYAINDQGLERGYILLTWADLRMIIFLSTNAVDEVQKEVDEAVAAAEEGEKWGIYAQAADVIIDLDDKRIKFANIMINKSLEMGEYPYNLWVKSKIQAVEEDYAGATATAQKAMSLGEANPKDRFYSNYKGTIEKMVKKWQTQ